MSLVQPGDLEQILPSYGFQARQSIIDRAEASVAERIGFQAYLDDPDIEEGVADSQLGQRAIDQTFRVNIRYTNKLELPVGPWVTWTGLTIDGTAIDFADLGLIKMRPWSLTWVDGSRYFTIGQQVAIQGTIGWTSGNLSGRVREAIYQTCAALSASREVQGQLATPAIKSSRQGPFATTYETGGASDATSERLTQDLPSVDRLLINWRRPDLGI